VQRKWTCLVPLSLAGRGGLPRFLGWFIGPDYTSTQNSCNPSYPVI
jgi:hypothetical protein